MEDQLGALGLVVNILVLWTTLYMDRALAQLRAQGATIHDEDVARGEFRPLRDPAELDDEDLLFTSPDANDI